MLEVFGEDEPDVDEQFRSFERQFMWLANQPLPAILTDIRGTAGKFQYPR